MKNFRIKKQKKRVLCVILKKVNDIHVGQESTSGIEAFHKSLKF